MIIGTLSVQMNLHGIDSLKAKRSIVKSLVERLRNKFNVSASEIAAHDNKRLGIVGICVVSNQTDHVQKQLDTIINFIHADGRFFVGRIEREIFTSDDGLDYL